MNKQHQAGCEQCGSFAVVNRGEGPQCGRCNAPRVEFVKEADQ